MKLQAAKMLLEYAVDEGMSIQLTTGHDITIDTTSEANTIKLLSYAARTHSAKDVHRADRDVRIFTEGPPFRLE